MSVLLRQKKMQKEDQNWCVVLTPIASEIDKKRVSQKISTIFNLTSEEADDLVSNTPIIILDNLSYSTAAKLKEYFRAAGAETLLTNDVFQKRKCYRTVWPEPPNLSFLHDWSLSAASKEQEALQPEEALQEIRSLIKEKRPSETVGHSAISPDFIRERDRLISEVDRWRKECDELREEEKSLREELEQLKKSSAEDDDDDQEEAAGWSSDREDEIREIRTLLGNAEERYQTLKEEYREACAIYEEKIAKLMKENEPLKTRGAESESSLRALEEKIREQEELISRKTKALSEAEDQGKKVRLDFEQKLLERSEEFQRLGLKWKEAMDRLELLQKAKEQIELTLNEQAEKIIFWRDRHDAVAAKNLVWGKSNEEEQSLLDKLQAGKRDLEIFNERLRHELDEKSKLVKEWEIRSLDQEKRILLLNDQVEQQKNLLETLSLKAEEQVRELEAKNSAVRAAESRFIEQEKQMASLKESFQAQRAFYEDAVAKSESRERELEIKQKELLTWETRFREQERQMAAQREVYDRQQILFDEMTRRANEHERELEIKQKELLAWEARFHEQEKQLAGQKEAHAMQQLILENLTKRADERERELEAARKQLREINTQIEQRETVAKRVQLASQIADKETILKKLVQNQESIASEIREREESIRRILAEQETVEKEIMEAKQAQRHLVELSKRDKGRLRTAKDFSEGNETRETPSND